MRGKARVLKEYSWPAIKPLFLLIWIKMMVPREKGGKVRLGSGQRDSYIHSGWIRGVGGRSLKRLHVTRCLLSNRGRGGDQGKMMGMKGRRKCDGRREAPSPVTESIDLYFMDHNFSSDLNKLSKFKKCKSLELKPYKNTARWDSCD